MSNWLELRWVDLDLEQILMQSYSTFGERPHVCIYTRDKMLTFPFEGWKQVDGILRSSGFIFTHDTFFAYRQ